MHEITTALSRPKPTYEQNAGYAKINSSNNTGDFEKFNVASFFKNTLNLEEDVVGGEMEKDATYTLYIAESKRQECPKLKIMIGREEVSALLDTGCELSILNEQLYNKLRHLGLNCLELPTQHLNLVSEFNERSKRIKKQALLKIQIGDSTVDQVVLLTPQLLTDVILGLDFLIDHAAELSFPDRMVSLKINGKFCKITFQGAREVTRQEVEEASFAKQVRDFAHSSIFQSTTAHLSADSDTGTQHYLECTAVMPGDKLGEVSGGEARTDIHQGVCLVTDDGSQHCEDACDVKDFPATYDVAGRSDERRCYNTLGLNKEGQVADIIDDSMCVRERGDNLSDEDDSVDDARLYLTTSCFEPNYVMQSQKPETNVNSQDDRMITADQLRVKVCESSILSPQQQKELYGVLIKYQQHLTKRPGRI